MSEMNEKKILIMECITKDDCSYLCDDELFNCESCSSFEECYISASTKCYEEFVKNIDCCGYNTLEDFLEQLTN